MAVVANTLVLDAATISVAFLRTVATMVTRMTHTFSVFVTFAVLTASRRITLNLTTESQVTCVTDTHPELIALAIVITILGRVTWKLAILADVTLVAMTGIGCMIPLTVLAAKIVCTGAFRPSLSASKAIASCEMMLMENYL